MTEPSITPAGTPPSAPVESTLPPQPAKRRGCFGMALKTTLGCAAFVLGAIAVLVILLPSLVEGVARSSAEDLFSKACRGTISVREVSLSWRKPQKITEAVLFDPDKREVGRLSVEMPSILGLFSGETKRVRVDIDADLVADDQGVVNLQRAIEIRPEAKSNSGSTSTSSSSSSLDFLETLDAEVIVASRRLSWSDADTRKRNQPFEIRGFEAKLRAKPGEPLTLHATGEVVSDVPGALAVDATLRGPIDADRSWPFGDVDATVTLGAFSTPMIDGIAGLGGKLTEVLGPRFDLKITAAGVTPEKGEATLSFSSERSSVDFAGEFAGGILRSRDGAPILLKLGVPRGFVTEALKAKLPPRMTVAWEETDKPWTVTISNLELPIPDVSGASGANAAAGAAGLAKTLEHLRCDVTVDLPARIAFETPDTKAAKLDAAIRGLKLAFAAAPDAPARVRVETTIDTGKDSPLVVEATVPEPWKSLASGGVPAFEATVRVQGLATAAIDALAAQKGRLAGALGPTLSVNAEVHAEDAERRTVAAAVETPRMKLSVRGSGDAATWLRSEGDEGFDLTWDPPAGWIDREAAAFLPEGTTLRAHPGTFEVRGRGILVPAGATAIGKIADTATLDLAVRIPALTVTSASEGKSLPPADLDPIEVDAKLAKGGALTVAVRTGLAGGSAGRVAVEASAEKLSAVLARTPSAVASAKLALEGLSTAMLDVIAGEPGFVSGALGPSLTVSGSATIAGANVAGAVDVTSPTTKVHLAGKLENGKVVASGKDGLELSTTPSGTWLGDRLAKSLPPGASLALLDPSRPIELSVRDVELPMPVRLEGLSCKVECKVPGLRYAGPAPTNGKDAKDANAPKTSKTEANVRDLALSADVSPGKPLHAKVTAAVDAGPALGGGKLAADISVPDPWALMKPNAPAVPALDAEVKLDGLPTASLDAVAGKPGFFSGLFGPAASLSVSAKVASADSGTVNASLASDGAKVSASAKLEKGVVVGAGDSALEVTANLSQAWIEAQLGPLLPKGAKLALADKSGAVGVHVKDLRMPLPTGPLTAEALAKTSLRLTASLPDLAYTDAAAGSPPAVVRGFALEATIAPGKPPEAKLGAKVEGTPPGELTANVRALDPITKLAEEKGMESFHVAADVDAKALPTGLVDALAAQGGLLVDVLGPRFDVKVHSDSISQTDGNFTASLVSETASVTCDRGSMKDKVLHLEKAKGKNEAVLASVPLSPLFSEKVVGSLVPALVNLVKAKPNDPITVAVEELSFPLDADLSKLDAIVRVNLGEVIAHPLPGLAQMMGKGSGGVNMNIPEIRVPIQKGVASYDGLPFPIGGKTYPLKGTFNLVDKSFRMQTQVPLSALGSGVSGKLDGFRSVLDPNTPIPIELRGTWKSPKIGVGDDFLKKVAEDALKKQGGGLLEGFLKKKK